MDATIENLLTKTEIKERGWTDGAIKKFLGEPDKTAPNPHSKKAAEVKLFSCDRVKAIENSQEWQDWYQKTLERRQKQSKAVNKRIEEQTEKKKKEIKAKFKIRKVPREISELVSEAIGHYWEHKTDFLIEREKYEEAHTLLPPDEREVSADFLERIIYNYIRHEKTNYEYLLDVFLDQGSWFRKDEVYLFTKELIEEKVNRIFSKPLLDLIREYQEKQEENFRLEQ